MPRSSYYYILKHAGDKAERDRIYIEEIKKLPEEDRKRGSRVIAKLLSKRMGIPVNHKLIERICREYGLLSEIRRPKHPKDYYRRAKESDRSLNGNILNREFYPDSQGAAYATDISYFRVKEGWLYLSAIKDLHNKEIVAAECSHKCDEALAVGTLKKLRSLKHCENAIMHSDRGSTYTGRAFLEECEMQGFTKSFSRKGNCWDNACMESFFGTVKCETEYHKTLKSGLWSYEDAERKIKEFIDRYNNDRIQKKLGWLSPVEYRKQHDI